MTVQKLCTTYGIVLLVDQSQLAIYSISNTQCNKKPEQFQSNEMNDIERLKAFPFSTIPQGIALAWSWDLVL